MKKIIIFIFFILFNQIIFAQKEQYYNFITTWNFIKYYHPDLASGKVNADSLFFKTVKSINSKDDFNSVIHKLSQNLNKNLTTSDPTETSKDVLSKNQNFDWFQKNGKISPENKNLLNHIYKNRYNFELLGKGKSVSDEKQYSFPKNENLPLEYRLLTLTKIKGSIDYLFPHKYLMAKDFDKYFKASLEENSSITSRKDFEIILAKLVAKLEDTHALNFYKQLNYKKEIYNGTYFAPFDFQIVDEYILITKLIFPEICSKAGITVGDKIISIDGKSIPQIIKEKGELLSVSNSENLLFVLSQYQNNLVWINNPDWGGFIYHYLYKYFSPRENYFGKYYQPNLKNIGTFVYKDYDYFPTIPNKTTHLYKGKVFIIVNQASQSASEWYTMNLQHIFPQAITIGQRTAGADGDLTKVNLPGDYLLEFTGNGIFYPDNSQTQQTGIRINEMIKYTDKDILTNRDLEFERIISLVK